MKTRLPTSKEIAELVAFMPRLYSDGFAPINQWRGGTQGQDGVFTMAWPEYDEIVVEFFRVAAGECWTDHDYDPEEAGKMLEDHNIVENATLYQIKTMFTYCVRGERFCDGHWDAVIEGGDVHRLLKRLAEIGRLFVRNESREQLVKIALEWQKRYGVAPQITSSISEFDAAALIGVPDEEYSAYMQDKTAVTKGFDFEYRGVRYQVKGNRPSGKPGSKITMVPKASNYDWDVLIWVMYDQDYVIREAWAWNVEEYRNAFHSKKRLSPDDYRHGRRLA